MSDKLTKLDVDNLIDSVELWEDHGEVLLQSYNAMRSMYTDPEQLAEFDTATKFKIVELKKSIKIKKYQAILLKYKLVKIKDSIEASLALDKFGEIGKETILKEGTYYLCPTHKVQFPRGASCPKC
jgi:C-terminal processing protease CtpA/Prc